MEKTFTDFMGCANNADILAQLHSDEGEQIVFSCIVIKYNRWGMKQDRTFLLTNQNLYNIKKTEVQRKIEVKSIKSVTKSTQANNLQFIVHIKSQYDYMFESDYRKEIFDALKYVFWKTHGCNLPVYGVNDKLKDYATTKKDINNGYEVKQKDEHRMKAEDIYQEDYSASSQMSTAGSSGSSSSMNDEIN